MSAENVRVDVTGDLHCDGGVIMTKKGESLSTPPSVYRLPPAIHRHHTLPAVSNPIFPVPLTRRLLDDGQQR